MYDPAGSDTKREWIEVYNAGTQDVDLSTWFLQENNIFHKFVAQAGSVLPAGSYAILADSVPEVLADYANYIGLIFDSVFSLNNTGEVLSIANPQKQLIDTVTYSSTQGGNDNGQSLQINNGQVITASPTFGQINKTESEIIVEETEDETGNGDSADTSTSSSGTSTSSGSTTSGSTHSQQEGTTSYTPTSSFKIGAGRKRVVSVHTPLELQAYNSKPDTAPRYLWNFGDFFTDLGRKVKHIYTEAGIYQIVLEGKTNDYLGISRTEVSVVEPQLDITTASSSVSIHNMSKQEVNIGDFVFNFAKGKNLIPRNTIIKGGATISLGYSTSTVLQSLEYPDGEIYEQFDTIE